MVDARARLVCICTPGAQSAGPRIDEGDLKQPIPFGKYFLLERINVGGMAEVFKAKATGVEGFERLVAVKRILPSIAEDEEFITMFVDEAKIAVQLTHANIAQIFDLGRVEGSFFIALEYVHGKDLRAMFNRTRQRGELLPIPMSCYAIMKLCEGLDYAHNKHDSNGDFLNLVHRDVSPQNIILSYEGEVKIIDFGIAKAAGKAGRTQAGILKGKFGYMSPEQVLGLDIDRRSDVFGVGICLYELLTGERLFVAESDFATLEKVRSGDVMPPSTYNRRIPEELEQIVMRALARDREERYQTALQLHDELQSFMHTSGNLFSRKDLSSYMHRMFGEEIERENARDLEYAQVGTPNFVPEPSGLEVFDEIDPVSTVSALHSQQVFAPGPGPRVSPNAPSWTPPLPSGPPPSGSVSRQRKATLLGIPQVSARPSGKAVPTVPRLVPRLQSVPPSAAARAAQPQSSPKLNPAPTPQSGAMPVPPQLTPPAGSQRSPSTPGMEWDDEELSTQIYDKPDVDTLAFVFGKQTNSPDSLPSAPPAALIAPVAAPPDRGMHPFARPASEPSLQPPAAGPLPQRTAASISGSYGAPNAQPFRSEATAPARAELPVSWDQPKTKSSPAVVAILVVVGIIASIVAGLLLFGRPEPGTVQFATVPNKVSVTVDDQPVPSTASPFVLPQLTPGTPHTIVVSQTGYRSWTNRVELQPGQSLQLPTVKLEKIETGFSIDSEPPGASVLVDGQRVAETPARLVDLKPGEYQLRLERAGHAPWENVLLVSAGTVLPLQTVTLQALAPESASRTPSGTLTAAEASARRRSSRQPVADDDDDGDTDSAEPAPPSAPNRRAAAPASDPAPAAEPDEPVVDEPADDPAAEAVATGPGTLRVNSRPWSQVIVDGKPYGVTPQRGISLPAGTHTLELVNDEFGIKKTLQVEIKPGEITTKVLNLTE